jgi:hypothetical protein
MSNGGSLRIITMSKSASRRVVRASTWNASAGVVAGVTIVGAASATASSCARPRCSS